MIYNTIMIVWYQSLNTIYSAEAGINKCISPEWLAEMLSKSRLFSVHLQGIPVNVILTSTVNNKLSVWSRTA